jgi:hypothetical protein
MPVVINDMEIVEAEPPRARGDSGGDGGGGGGEGAAKPPTEDDFERVMEEQRARHERLRAH